MLYGILRSFAASRARAADMTACSVSGKVYRHARFGSEAALPAPYDSRAGLAAKQEKGGVSHPASVPDYGPRGKGQLDKGRRRGKHSYDIFRHC